MSNLITSDVATEVEIVATAGQTVFSFGFAIFAASDLRVLVNGVAVSSGFGVNGVMDPAGGSITFTAGRTAGDVVLIERVVPIKRTVDLPVTGPVNMDIVDSEFDVVMAGMQQLKTRSNRALTVPLGDAPQELPSAANRASKYAAFDAAGNLLMSEGTGADAGLRGDLASNGSPLIKHKRSGVDTYARTMLQWAAVGGADDDNLMNWVHPDLDADLIAGTSAVDALAYFNNADGGVANAYRRARLFMPAFKFYLSAGWIIENSNIHVDAPGATIRSDMVDTKPLLNISGRKVTVEHLRGELSHFPYAANGYRLPYMLNVLGEHCHILSCDFDYTSGGNGVAYYTGDGTTTSFTLPSDFYTVAPEHLEVKVAGTIQEGTYTVVLGVDNLGGTVTFDTPPASGVPMVMTSIANGNAIYVRGVDGFWIIGCAKRGNNAFVGIFEGSDARIENNTVYHGSDDFLGIKANTRASNNIHVLNNLVYQHTNLLSIGSGVGMQGADDPTNSRRVTNVICKGNIGVACGALASIRPGGNTSTSLDYRDGLVDGVDISHNQLFDPNGRNFMRGLELKVGRRGIIRNVTGVNNTIVARCLGQAGVKAGALTIRHVVGDPCTIEDVKVEINYRDPHGGAAFGTAGVPAHPVDSLVDIAPASLTLRRIRLPIRGSGSRAAGMTIGAGADNEIILDSVELRKTNAGGFVSGGIYTDSVLKIAGENPILEPANGPKYTVGASGAIKGFKPVVLAQSAVPVSHTGDLLLTTLKTVVIPGETIGPNGYLEVEAIYGGNDNTDSKTQRIRLNGSINLLNSSTGGNSSLHTMKVLANRGSETSQLIATPASTGPGYAAANGTAATNTAADCNLTFEGQLGLSTDEIRLEFHRVVAHPGW